MPNEKDMLPDDALEQLFSDVRAQEHDAQLPENKMFLNQLSAIPAMHQQQQTTGEDALTGLIEKWLSPSFLLSARGLVSQGAFALILLMSGIVTGLELADTEPGFDDYDVSASLFGGDTIEYSIDG